MSASGRFSRSLALASSVLLAVCAFQVAGCAQQPQAPVRSLSSHPGHVLALADVVNEGERPLPRLIVARFPTTRTVEVPPLKSGAEAKIELPDAQVGQSVVLIDPSGHKAFGLGTFADSPFAGITVSGFSLLLKKEAAGGPLNVWLVSRGPDAGIGAPADEITMPVGLDR